MQTIKKPQTKIVSNYYLKLFFILICENAQKQNRKNEQKPTNKNTQIILKFKNKNLNKSEQKTQNKKQS